MDSTYFNWSIVALTCGVIAAKWSMELGFHQFRQLLWGIAGLILGPIARLILDLRLLIVRQKNGLPDGSWISGRVDTTAA